jgi:hypothetical protein
LKWSSRTRLRELEEATAIEPAQDFNQAVPTPAR